MTHQIGRPLEYSPTMPSSPGRRLRSAVRIFVLPLLTSLILLIPTVLYWAHARSVSAEFQQSRVAQYRLRLSKRIQTEVDSQLRPLRRLAGEIAAGDVNSPATFASSARSICREEPTLKYVGWVARDGQTISVFPSEAAATTSKALFGSTIGNRNLLMNWPSGARDGMLLPSPATDSARLGDRLIVLPIIVSITGAIDTVTTSRATQMPDPEGRPIVSSAIVTCETTQAMLGAMIPPDASAPVIVEVRDERGRVLFASDGATTPVAQALLRAQDVDQIPVLDRSWSMSVAAAPPGLGQRPASDTDAFLLSGLIVALLGAATVAQAARHRRREQQKAADHLATLEALLEEQRRLNQQVRLDAEAKAMLLRELNHRVKNNLAGIVGLLSVGVPELSEQAQEWLDRAIARIETLARAHELFVGNVSGLGLAELVRNTLEPVYAIKPIDVQIVVDVAEVNVPLTTDQAVTLAMVLHELASNALQHGVGDHGTVRISAAQFKPGWVRIEVMDDGAASTSFGETGDGAVSKMSSGGGAVTVVQNARSGVGLQLVRGLVGRELHGTFAIRQNITGGMTATMEFPIYGQPSTVSTSSFKSGPVQGA